jgi:hypothetical protein
MLAILVLVSACSPVEREPVHATNHDSVRTVECVFREGRKLLTVNELSAKADSIIGIDVSTLGVGDFYYRYVEQMANLKYIKSYHVKEPREPIDLDSLLTALRNPKRLERLRILYNDVPNPHFWSTRIDVPNSICLCDSLTYLFFIAANILASEPLPLRCLEQLEEMILHSKYVSPMFDYSHMPNVKSIITHVRGKDAEKVIQQLATCPKLKKLDLRIFDMDSSDAIDSVVVANDFYKLRIEELHIGSGLTPICS